MTALLGTAFIPPYVLLRLFAGALADRVDRRRLMIGCEFTSAVALGSVPAASGLGILSTAQLYVATILAGIAFVGFDSAQFGALPALFGRARLITATTALGSVDNALYIVGTALGGLLEATVGAAPAIGLDAASFVVSGLLLTGVRGSFGDARDQQATSTGWGCWRSDIAEGMRFLWHHRLIRALTLAGSAAALTGGAVTGLLVVYAVRQLGLSDSESRIGLLFSAGALGALVATVVVPRLTRRYDIPRLNLVARTASLLLVVVLAMLHSFVLALGVRRVQRRRVDGDLECDLVPPAQHSDHLQGRVNVVGRMTALAGQPIGAALGGTVAELTDVRTALLVMSVGLAASTVGGWLSPLRTASTTKSTEGSPDEP